MLRIGVKIANFRKVSSFFIAFALWVSRVFCNAVDRKPFELNVQVGFHLKIEASSQLSVKNHLKTFDKKPIDSTRSF